MYCYKYPRPAVCVDIIVIYKKEKLNFVLLIKRKNSPFKNKWALPGGFVEMNETLEESAIRELYEETTIKCKTLKQFAAYGNPGRDPRGRTVSIVYYCFLNKKIKPTASDDASEAQWVSFDKIPETAFDHEIILKEFYNTFL